MNFFNTEFSFTIWQLILYTVFVKVVVIALDEVHEWRRKRKDDKALCYNFDCLYCPLAIESTNHVALTKIAMMHLDSHMKKRPVNE